MKMAGTVGVGIVCTQHWLKAAAWNRKRNGNYDFHHKIKHIDCFVFVIMQPGTEKLARDEEVWMQSLVTNRITMALTSLADSREQLERLCISG